MFKLKFIKEQYWQFHAQVAIIGSVHSIILFASIYTIIINTRFSIKDSNISCCQGKLFLIALCVHVHDLGHFLTSEWCHISWRWCPQTQGAAAGAGIQEEILDLAWSGLKRAILFKSSRGREEFKPCTDLWALLWISSSASGSVAACVAAAPGGGH